MNLKKLLKEEIELSSPCKKCGKEIKEEWLEEAWNDGLCEKCHKKSVGESLKGLEDTVMTEEEEKEVVKEIEGEIEEEYRTKGSRDRRQRKKRSKIKPSWLKKSGLGKFL